MMGENNEQGILQFWNHIKTCEAWRLHTTLHSMCDQQLGKCIPCAIFADGAEMFRDDEFFVWSWSSAFSTTSLVTDVLLHRFPIALVAEREMLDDNVFWFKNLVWSLFL